MEVYMKSEKEALPAITLVGISVRTSFIKELVPRLGSIAKTAEKFIGGNLASDILHRSNPGVVYGAYTDYETNENGKYTYFIGEEVTSLDGQDMSAFETMTIPAATYHKFISERGKIPDVIIKAWKGIWMTKKEDFFGERTYQVDFELIGERAKDLDDAEVDIYIGIK